MGGDPRFLSLLIIHFFFFFAHLGTHCTIVFTFNFITFFHLKSQFNIKESLTELRIRFLTILKDVLRKINNFQLKRMKTFKHLKFLKDIRWIIEVKIHLTGEFNESFVKHMPRMGRNSYSKTKRTKRMEVYHKCARWS